MEQALLESGDAISEHHERAAELRAEADGEDMQAAFETERYQRLRQAILDMDPHYTFASDNVVFDLEPNEQPKETQEQGLTSSHKQNYGRWARYAMQALKAAGTGAYSFPELAEVAIKTIDDLMFTSDKDMEALRGALHGLARRKRKRVVEYVPAPDGGPGAFRLISPTTTE